MEIEIHGSGQVRLENDLAALGFTLYKSDFDDLSSRQPCGINEFVNAIFTLEGMNPDSVDRRLWRQVRDVVANAHRQSSEGG